MISAAPGSGKKRDEQKPVLYPSAPKICSSSICISLPDFDLPFRRLARSYLSSYRISEPESQMR